MNGLCSTHLQDTIRAGAVIYDIGANVGVFAVHLARWAGVTGWVYAIEPNPTCVYFLRANLATTGMSNFTHSSGRGIESALENSCSTSITAAA